MQNDPPATAHLLRRLSEEKVVTPAEAIALEQLLRDRLPWRPWAERVLLALGAAMLLAGTIFFFAYNWSSLAPMAKFGIVEGGLVLCAGAACWLGLHELAGKIGLFACCVMTGVFLALHGQIYQTGADSWLLFAAWAALILPWVVMARFAALWFFWLGLINTAVVLWWDFRALGSVSPASLLCTLALLDFGALAARELAVRRGAAWLDEGWLRGVLAMAIYGCLTLASCIEIAVERGAGVSPALLVGLGAAGYAAYRAWLPSLAILSVIVLSGATVLVFAIGKALLENAREPLGIFFLLALIVLGIFGGAVAWLRREAAQLRGRSP